MRAIRSTNIMQSHYHQNKMLIARIIRKRMTETLNGNSLLIKKSPP
jgi:hypothetical protein